jgi:hypothetical protein
MSDKHQYPSQKLEQIILRLPDGMRARIKAAARNNCRSMNAEIVYQLQKAITQSETKKADAAA